MDFEFDINIFGAPYSFELYKGDDWTLNYFSIFDNTSDEPVKMTVHRIDNKVMYNYLRYGYITSSGRPGSFFGISVGFKDAYCSDFALMYQLFEGVFQTIIEKGVIFQAQNQYKIQFFTEAVDEIGRIKRVLGQNIRGVVAEKIMPINFTNSEPDKQKAALLSTVAGNSRVWESLNKYAMVSISPNYSGVSPDPASDNVEVIVPADVLMTLSSGVKQIAKSREDISRDVLLFQAEFAKNKNKPTLKSDYDSLSSKLKKTISNRNNIILTIKQWCNNNPKNIAALKKLLGRISEIDQKPPTLRELAETMAIYKDKIKAPVHDSDKNDTDGKENNAGDATKDSREKTGTSQSSSQKTKDGNGFGAGHDDPDTGYGTGWLENFLAKLRFLAKHRKSLLGIVVVLIIICFVVFCPKNTDDTSSIIAESFENEYDSLMNEARNKFLAGNWAGASKEYEKIIEKNDTSTNKYTRIQDVKDSMQLCKDSLENSSCSMKEVDESVTAEDKEYISSHSEKEEVAEQSKGKNKGGDEKDKKNNSPTKEGVILLKNVSGVLLTGDSVPAGKTIKLILKYGNEEITDATWTDGTKTIKSSWVFNPGEHKIQGKGKGKGKINVSASVTITCKPGNI